MIFLAILCVILFGGILYFGYRAYYLAGQVSEAQEYIEELELTNEYMYARISDSFSKMKEIDRLGAFEADDESGTTFSLLNEVITNLKTQFDGEAQEEK